MASTFPGGSSSASHQLGSLPSSMLGFGPASNAPLFGSSEQSQRLQYYQSPQHASAPSSEKIAGRRAGKVKFFDTQKGFGFINDYRPEEIGNEEVFVHYTSISAKSGFRSLAEGEEAEYEIVRGPKGFQAANVTGPSGAQVLGDNRRNNKNTYMAISPYATMYPYIQQDPNAFYAAASPYNQPIMMMPQQDYRVAPPPTHAPSPYRNLSPYPANPGLSNPGLSPYGSPGPIRSLDIGKDFGGMSLGGLSVDEGSRKRAPQQQSAPFGGMFGTMPSFDSSRAGSAAAAFAQQPVMHNSGNGGGMPSGAVAGRSGSVDSGDKSSSAAPRQREESNASSRPSTLHSRSSSLLYASGGKNGGNGLPA